MRICVHARHWDAKLVLQFGEEYSIHEMTHQEVFQAMLTHGRAEIETQEKNNYPMKNLINRVKQEFDYSLEFQNDYD